MAHSQGIKSITTKSRSVLERAYKEQHFHSFGYKREKEKQEE